MPEADQSATSPSPQRGGIRQSCRVFKMRSRLLPSDAVFADRLPSLLPAAQTVVAIRRRPSGQDGERLATVPTQSPPHPDPVLLRVVGLLAPLSVADDRFLSAQRTPTRHLLQADSCYPGTVLSSAPGNAINRITAGVKAGRWLSLPGLVRRAGLHPPSCLKNVKRKKEYCLSVGWRPTVLAGRIGRYKGTSARQNAN